MKRPSSDTNHPHPSRSFIASVATIAVACYSMLAACNANGNRPMIATATPVQRPSTPAPTFCADSAYSHAARQLDFGPRVPGSKAHDDCASWLEAKLRSYGAAVRVEHADVTAYDGSRLVATNITASLPGTDTTGTRRALLVAHWDSRHVADQDADPARRHEGVPAANDGASGVAVLLEVARLAARQGTADSDTAATNISLPHYAIDILLTDVEDYGAPDTWGGPHRDTDWALGTQAWAQQARREGYRANFAILLDMVGAPDATFYREYFSDRSAPHVVDLVWSAAQRLGYGSLFVNRQGAAITDDHVFIERIAHIPAIDIIDTRPHEGHSFYPYWHTTDDTLDKLSPSTLQSVGDVLVDVLWRGR